jgi:hypothetical protein
VSDDADAALQRAIADACLGADHPGATTLREFLETRGVAVDDVEAILAAPARLFVYRSLVRNGIGSVVQRLLPRTLGHLETACPGRFDADMRAFAHQLGPRTHYLRDVPAEFIGWVAPRWQTEPSVPGYLVDLATHELTHLAVAAAADAGPRACPTKLTDLSLERPVIFSNAMRIVHYHWAVHELPTEDSSGRALSASVPARRDVTLIAYRDREHAVRWLELSALAGDVISALAAGTVLGTAVEQACADHGVAPQAVLGDIARLLADLGTRGVLLGANDA